MRITEALGLNVSQYEIDFLDADLDNDNPLYIDPFLIANSNSQWAINADRTIKNFFNEFKRLILEKRYDEVFEISRYLSESKENNLGVSSKGTTNGHGVGEIDIRNIVEHIIKSNAIVDGLIVNLEDIILFVDQIDKDKLSDMTTNIIRKELIKYTQDQCKLWGIPLETETTLPYWVPEEKSWMYSEEQLLIIENREILLVPKFIVSPINIYNASKYNWHYVVEQERNFHLSRRSELVRVKRLKGGRLKYYLPKKDVNDHINNQIKRGDYLNRKDYIKEYTKKHPELLQTFISDSRKISKSLKNENIASTLKIVDDIDEIIELLKINLARIPVGKDSASTYHKYIKSLLEILWYPYLTNPIIEREIHEGRKRIDIVMDNNATEGFFHKIHDVSKVFCPYIFIECKNYGREVSNPELDQLSGRFATMRGQLGLLLCRAVTDRKLLLKRCKDTFSDGRGLIIPLTDDDIIQMLDYTKEDNIMKIWDYLDNITREIML